MNHKWVARVIRSGFYSLGESLWRKVKRLLLRQNELVRYWFATGSLLVRYWFATGLLLVRYWFATGSLHRFSLTQYTRLLSSKPPADNRSNVQTAVRSSRVHSGVTGTAQVLQSY